MAETRPLNLVFMGTPELAASVLRALLSWKGGRVRAVYCQPDRPSGRGLIPQEPPVKKLALEHGLPVLQPLNFKEQSTTDELAAFEPDYLLVAAYGLILPQKVLDLPRRFALNVHTSLLPKLRGAAPIQRAVLAGMPESGISIMAMDAGLDTGPVVLQQKALLQADETSASLHDRLAALGGPLLVRAIEGLEKGGLSPIPQDNALATYAPKLEKKEGAADFARSAAELDQLIRGMNPWPGAYAYLHCRNKAPLRVSLLKGNLPGGGIGEEHKPGADPGAVLGLREGALAVQCADEIYLVREIKPAGKKTMTAASFANGYLEAGEHAFLSPVERP